MRKAIIIIFTVIAVALFLVVGGSVWHFFVPVNSSISKEITRATPITFLAHAEGNGEIYSCVTQSGTLKNEDLSWLDKAALFNLISKCKYVNDENPVGSGECDLVFQFLFVLSEKNNVADKTIEILIAPSGENNVYDVGVIYYDCSRYEYAAYKLEAKSDYIEKLRDKLSKKGFELKMKNYKPIDEKYSEAIEKIKNS